jgi:hypothetical protein
VIGGVGEDLFLRWVNRDSRDSAGTWTNWISPVFGAAEMAVTWEAACGRSGDTNGARTLPFMSRQCQVFCVNSFSTATRGERSLIEQPEQGFGRRRRGAAKAREHSFDDGIGTAGMDPGDHVLEIPRIRCADDLREAPQSPRLPGRSSSTTPDAVFVTRLGGGLQRAIDYEDAFGARRNRDGRGAFEG